MNSSELFDKSVNAAIEPINEMLIWSFCECGLQLYLFEQRDKVKAARFQYSRVVEFLQFSDNLGGEEGLERDQLVLAAHLNMALCNLKMGKHKEALESAGKALEIDGKNTKAIFRRGMVKWSLSFWDIEHFVLKVYSWIIFLDEEVLLNLLPT